MTQISIRERARGQGDANATVSFDHGPEYPATIKDPFSEKEEQQLEWYFEQHLRLPFLRGTDAAAAAASVRRYGEALFNQVFAERNAYSCYKQALQGGPGSLHLEIAGSPDFHRLHWESLRDPDLDAPLCLHGIVVRKNLAPSPIVAHPQVAPTINLLLVTARPGGAGDVGYRTISRPMVEMVRQARLRVRVDILRPGSYKALFDHLEARGSGFYHAVHFDVHGAVLTHDQMQAARQTDRYLFQARYGRPDIQPYEGRKAFLFLQGMQDGQADPVEATELAGLLLPKQVPLVILNACQSGKQVGASETSLGSRLMQAGVQMVLAMGYSVTVSAAERLMRALYGELFAGKELAAAVRRGRQELHNDKARRAYYDQKVDLEDWLLPVLYQNREVRLAVRDFTPQEEVVHYERQATRYPFPQPAYGFWGRDLDILEIEKRVLGRGNLLLVRGMGGSGKTTLLRHLGAWWQTTGFVDQVLYFGYDQKGWTWQQLLHEMARQLLGEVEYGRRFQPMSPRAQQALMAERLRGTRHLLVLDNLESITGTHLAIGTALPEAERAALRGLLADLAGGRTMVLLGSRGGEEWLKPGTFGDNVYELAGLDPEAASGLCEKVLERHGVVRYREDPEMRKLMKLLAGYPLALEVVLANLAQKPPGEILAALQAGGVEIDAKDAKDKTQSILRCIDYSHGNLPAEAQELLLCLAPFTSVIFRGVLPRYTDRLKRQPAHLPFDRWPEVLKAAADWGLLRPHQVPGFLELQPVFPFFLRTRLNDPARAGLRSAVEAAFREVYDQYGNEIGSLLEAKEADKKKMGRIFASLEQENLATALQLALSAQGSIRNTYWALSGCFDALQDHRRGLELGESVRHQLESYPQELLAGRLGIEFIGVLDDIARHQLELKRYAEAQVSYQRALSLLLELTGLDERERTRHSASIYHQLGRVAQEQRQWTQTEQYYQKALEIHVEYNDRYRQASTYHNLGVMAQEQRQWAQSEQYYQKALQIRIEDNDRYGQADTYHQLGRVAEKQRQWPQAEQNYQKALQIKIEDNYRYKQASTYHQLGIVAQEQRQWAQAERYYQKALEIYVEYNDHYEQAGTYHQLGMVAEKQRQWAQAQQYYQKALVTYREFGDSHNGDMVLGSLARLYQATQDPSLAPAVAAALGISPEEAEALLRRFVVS